MPKDNVRLQHMLDAATEALSFAKGKSRADLNTDRMLALSLIKAIEIIGEAANKVSAEVKTKYTSIPWLDIIGMRNRLIHAYFEINLDILWKTITEDVPPLVAELEKIVPLKTD